MHYLRKIFNLFTIKLFVSIFVFGILFFSNSNTIEAAIKTWDGSTNSSWSVPSNWSGDTVPVTGDDLVFPAGASNLSNTNDLTENTIFNSITISGSGYTLSGNRIILGPGLAGITDSNSSGGNTIALDIRLDVTRNVYVTNSGETLTISGRIEGVGGVYKEGLGKLILSGANTFGGVVKVNVGVLNAQNSRALGTILAGTEVVGNASLELEGDIDISYEPLIIRGWGASSTGALRNISGNNTFRGLITLTSAGGAEIASDSGTLTLAGGITGTFPLIIDGAGNVTFTSTPIAISSGTVTKNGAGTLTYNFPNTYTGLTTVNAGTLAYGVDNAILSGGITVTGGTLNIGNYSDMVGTVTLGTLDLASGTITGGTGMLSSATWTVYNGTISAKIAGDGGALTKSTIGTVVLTRANEYTGATTISAGTLEIQDSYALGLIDGITTISAGATLRINGNGLSIPEYISVAGSGILYQGSIRNIGGNNTLTGLLTLSAATFINSDSTRTLTIDNKGLSAGTSALYFGGAGNITFTNDAPIYGTTSTLTKNDTGTLTIGSFSNITGTLTINKGELIFSDLGAMPLATTIAINAGGKLTLDNSTTKVNDRIADTAAITLNGGDFDFKGSGSSDVFETTGALTVGIASTSGDSKITITPGAGGATIMRFASLTRNAGASMLFRGTDFGSTPSANVSTLLFTTAPTLTGDDGESNTPNLSIIKGAFGDSSLSGTGTDMVTYDKGNSNGLRLLNATGFSGEYTTDLSITNANVKLTASTIASTTQINSLILSSSASISDAGSSKTITLFSGNILNLVNNASIDGNNTTLTMASNIEGIIRTVNDINISSIISTTGGITKSGTGTLTFSVAETYTGATSINEGTLLYTLDNNLSSGNVIVNGGILDIDSFSDSVGAVTLQDGIITGSSGVLSGSSYSFREGTVSAIIGGNVTVTRIATSTAIDSVVILTRENTYTGQTSISSGILKVGSAGDGTNSPLGTIFSGTSVASTGSLDLNGYTLSINEAINLTGLGFGIAATVNGGNSNMGALMNTSVSSVSYSGSVTLATSAPRINADYGAIIISGNISGALALTVGGFSDVTLSGVISTVSSITKDGVGVLTLSGDNSIAGTITVNSGTLKLGANGGGTNTPLGTTAAATVISTGARLDLNGYTLGTAEPLTLNGVGYGLGDFASGALINSSGSSVTYSGLITLGSTGVLIKADYGDINLTATGTITGNTFTLTLGGIGTGTLASIIGTGTGTLTKINTGTWTLSASASTYTGATSINLGKLKLGASGGATNTPLGVTTGATSILSGGSLDLAGYTLGTAEALTINGRGINDEGAIMNSGGALTYAGAITQASDSRIANNGSGLMTLSAATTISGAYILNIGGSANISTNVLAFAAGSIIKEGAGTLTATGTHTYTGATRIEGGTFLYGSGVTVLAGTNLSVVGGTFDMGTSTDTIGTVTLVDGTISNGTLTATTSYTVEKGTISAVLAGAIAFTKNTNNTVTLTGANTMSSTITINAGTLAFSGSGTATSVTGVTINLGGTLTLDNGTTSNTDRLSGTSNNIVITMNGGNLNFIGNSSGTSSETLGQLALSSGHNIVTVSPGAGGSTTLTFGNNPGFNRTAGATVLFRGTSFGSTPAANVSTLMFTTAPTLTGGNGSANSNTISIIKGAYGDSSLSGTGNDMVTYNVGNTNGLRLLNGAGFSGEYSGDLATANANVKLTANRVAVATNTNSLILNGFGITNPGNGLTIPVSSASLAGNILINSATDIAGANTTLGITTNELVILATANSTISAVIGTAVAGSLTLSGSGNVTLSAANLYTGTTSVNNATLTAGASNVLSSGGVTIVGGLYNLNGNSDSIGNISINAGTITTGAGTLTTATGSITTIANNNFTSLITGNLALPAGGGATFNIGDGLMDNDAFISAVISGSTTITKSTGTGVLMLSGNNTFTVQFTISAGTVRLGAAGGVTNTPLGTTAGNTVVSGAGSALDLNGYTLSTAEPLNLSGNIGTGALQNNSSGDVNYTGLVTLGSASTIISNYGDINITNTGNITGNTFGLTIGGAGNGTLASNLNTTTGTLTKNGLGTWIISGGASTFTGLTTISAGTLKLGSAGSGSNTPLGTNAGGVTVTSGAIFDINGYTLATAEPIGSLSGTGIASIGAFINSSNSSASYSGALTLAAASRVANYGSGTFTLSGNISGNFALTFVTVGGITQSSASVWSGTGTLVKEGSGTLILTGQNSMTGAMTVSTGKLQLGANGGATNTPLGTNAGGVTVSAGAVLDLSTYTLGGASTYETLNITGTGINNTGALIGNSSGNTNFGTMTVTTNARVLNSGSGSINFTGTITAAASVNFGVGGSGPVNISAAYGATATTATLTKWGSGNLTISVASITTGLVRINEGTLTYGVADALSTPALTVAGGGTLNLNGFNETNIGAVTLIDGTIANTGGAATLTSTTTYTAEKGTISAVLGGTSIAFAKNTGGTLNLNSVNAFTGATNVNAGTLNYGVSNALSSGNLTANGGIINLGTYSDTVGTVTLTSGEINSTTGVLTGTSYAVASGTASAILAGAVNLTKTTAGTVTLSGTNTYTGITTISGGTLSISSIGNGGVAGNLGQATNAAANIVFNTGTATLQYTGSTASTDRSYTTTTALTAQFDIINRSATLTWSGSGTVTTAPVNKIGPGTLKFSATQGHTGLTTVLQGTLQYGIADMLSNGTVTVNNGTLDINNFSDSVGVITLVNDGSIIDGGGSTAVLTTTGSMTLQSGTISARIGGTVGTTLNKSTTDRVTLSGDNSFTGTVISLGAGYLRLGHNNALGASGTGTTTTITSGAVLELVGNITIPATKAFSVSGSGISNVGAIRNISGTNTISANIPLGATNTRINSDAGSLTIPTVSGNTFNVLFGGAGDITVSGAISTTTGTLTKDGAGVLTLSGVNTYTGTTTISGGTIAASSTDSLGTGVSSNTLIFNGGTLRANGTITSPSTRAITLTGDATFDTNGNSITINGTVGSAGGLTKTGTGTLTLGNTTTVGGDLTISTGTLVAPTSLTLSGDFSNSGTYTHNNGTLLLTPADLSVSILGSSNTTFYDLTNNTANSTLTFKAGNTYTFAHTLTINGTANNRITVNSDNPGSQWYMTLSGTASVSYLNVKDSGCSGGNSVGLNYTLVNNGNNGACWAFVLISGGSSGNIESSGTPDPDQGGGGAGGGGGIEGGGGGGDQGGGGSGGGGGDIG